jgi:PmbA protein
MYDDPLLKKANGSVRWDAEGTPTRRVDFIREGILETFAYDLKTAYRFGGKSTASAIRNCSANAFSTKRHLMALLL